MYIYKCVWCTYVAIVSHAQEVEARVMVHPGSTTVDKIAREGKTVDVLHIFRSTKSVLQVE